MRIYQISTDETCDVCGRPASGIWQGDRRILICAHCSTEWLPALIADAAYVTDYRTAVRAVDRLISRFWRALAIRLLQEKDNRP